VQIGIAPETGGREIIGSGAPIPTSVTAGYDPHLAPNLYPPDETGIFYLNEVPLADTGARHVLRLPHQRADHGDGAAVQRCSRRPADLFPRHRRYESGPR